MAEKAVTDRAPTDKDAKNKKSSEAAFIRDAVKKFDRCGTAEAMNRQEAVEDLKFKKGDQWPEQIRSTRTLEKRPCLTINKVKTFVHQITNDQRQNRPAINISPIGDKADPATAKMLKGLIRQIERKSNADVAYDTGFDSAVSNGWGYWRIVTEYESEDSFDQVIRVRRIRNPFRVYLDPDHQEPDGSDAKWAFISDLVLREDYERDYPKADPLSWEEAGRGDEFKNWNTQTHVRIAEYFYYDTKVRQLVHLENGHIGYEDELDPSIQKEIKKNPKLVLDTRDVSCKKLKWCKITHKQILEENDWAGKWIPIVKVIGDETEVDGKVNYAGLIRDAKDAQRMYNFWCTAETELIALAPKAPWIMEEGQVEGHEQRWKDANVKSFPYLLYKGTSIGGKPAPAPQRQPFAGPPQGVVQAKMGAAQDMQAATGIRFDATLQERMYDESGKALRELKRTGDLGNFHYVDNHARSLRHTGIIFIDLIPKVYDTPRVLTIIRDDEEEETVKIDPTMQTSHMNREVGGKTEALYNPKLGEYDVTVTIGPSYASKRAEASDSMMAFVKAMPNSGALIDDLIAKNMDWPGAEEVSERLASAKPPQILAKAMKDFPPQAKAMITGLHQQGQQLQQQLQGAMQAIQEKKTEQAIEKSKNDQTFEAKLTDIATKMEIAMMKTMSQERQKMAEIMNQVAESVKGMEAKFSEQKSQQSQAPVHIHMGGKKKITTPEGKQYISEDSE